MIRTQDISKTYGSLFGERVKAVKKATFEVKKGEIFGFLGPNGAGKTTTIRMLTTILTPTSGSATVCGADIRTDPRTVRSKIGLMPEEPGFYEEMRCADILHFYAEFYGLERAAAQEKIDELLALVQLDAVRRRKIKNFSHGMRKRLALAQSLLNDPVLLILDEPTGGLDPQGTHNFREMIKRLNEEGLTIFLSSHILPEVKQMCDRVGIIDHGTIVAVDTIENLSERLTMKTGRYLYIEARGWSDTHLEHIETLPGISGMWPYQNGMSFGLVGGDDHVIPQVTRYLVEAGVDIFQIRPTEPTLEEVFLDLTTETAQTGEAHPNAPPTRGDDGPKRAAGDLAERADAPSGAEVD